MSCAHSDSACGGTNDTLTICRVANRLASRLTELGFNGLDCHVIRKLEQNTPLQTQKELAFYLRGYELYLMDAPNRSGLPPCLGGFDPANQEEDCQLLP